MRKMRAIIKHIKRSKLLFAFSLFLGLSTGAYAQMPDPVIDPSTCPATWISNVSTTGTLNTTGSKYCITGNHTGAIEGTGQVFFTTGSSFTGQMNKFSGEIYNYSRKFTAGSNNFDGANAKVYNYGTIVEKFSGINGYINFFNHKDDTLIINLATLNNGSIYNEGHLFFTKALQVNDKGSIVNQGYLTFELGTQNIDGVFENYGKILSKGKLKYQNPALFKNTCGIEVTGDLEITAGADISNEGVVVVGGILDPKGKEWINSSAEWSKVTAGTFSGDGKLLGFGPYYFVNKAANSNGTIGNATSDLSTNLLGSDGLRWPCGKTFGGCAANNPNVTWDANTYRATPTDYPNTCSDIVKPNDNTQPSADPLSVNLIEDGSANSIDLSVLVSDPDVDAVLTVTVDLTQTQNGVLTKNANGTYKYVPKANWSGTDSFVYQVCDELNSCSTATITLEVAPVNDPPFIKDTFRITVAEDALVANIISLVKTSDFNDNIDISSPDYYYGGILVSTFAKITDTKNGVSARATNNVTYKPNANFNGLDTLIFKLCDNGQPATEYCGHSVVIITVTPVNDPPVADDETNTFAEDGGTLTVNAANGVLVGDTDLDNDVLSVTAHDAGTNGTLKINANGSYTYTPNLDFHGQETVNYTVSDGKGGTDTGKLTITVTPVNDPIQGVSDRAVSTNEEVAKTISFTINDSKDMKFAPFGGVDWASLNVYLDAKNGSVSNVNTPATGDLTFTYTPKLNFVGVDSFKYEICDLGYPTPVTCDSGVVVITVINTNDPPVANNDSIKTGVLEDVLYTSTISVLANDTDADAGTILKIRASNVGVNTTTSGGKLTFKEDGTFTYLTKLNDYGVDSLMYEITDGLVNVVSYLIITANPVNDAPYTKSYTRTIAEDASVSVLLLDADVNDKDDLRYSDFGSIDWTKLSIKKNGTLGLATVNTTTHQITYQTTPDLNGKDTVIYEVCDIGHPVPALCRQDTVFITVTPVNDNPEINGSTTLTICEDNSGSIVFDVSDKEVATSALNVEILYSELAVTPWSTTLKGNTFTYTPKTNVYGRDSVVVRYYDNNGGADTSYAIVTITPVNDDFKISNDTLPFTVNEGKSKTLDIYTLLNDDIDYPSTTVAIADQFDITSIKLLSQTGAGTASFTGSTFTYDAGGFIGNDTIKYEVCDKGVGPLTCGGGANANVCLQAFILVQITDEAPESKDTTIADGIVWEDSVWSFDILLADLVSDPQGISSIASIDLKIIGASKGSILSYSFDADAVKALFEYKGTKDFNGLHAIEYTVTDDDGYTSTSVISFNVGAINDTVFANSDTVAVKTKEDNNVTLDVLANDNDVRDNYFGLGTDLVVNPLNALPYALGVDNTSLKVDSVKFGTAVVTAGKIVYTPTQNFFGYDTVYYQVCDLGKTFGVPTSLCDTAFAVVNVESVNDTLITMSDSLKGLLEDSFGVINVLANDSDSTDVIAGDITGGLNLATLTIITAPKKGVAIASTTTGEITYTPIKDYNGADFLTYQICDKGTPSICLIDTLFIVVDPVGDTINIKDKTFIAGNVKEDSLLTFDLLAEITDIRDVQYFPTGGINIDSFKVLVSPKGGTVTVVAGDFIQYEANSNFFGPDSFKYEICDLGHPDVSCDTGWVFFTVDFENDSAQLSKDVVSDIMEDTIGYVIAVLANDVDTLDGTKGGFDLSSIKIITAPKFGVATTNKTNGTIVYSPIANYHGLDTLVYEICDLGNLCLQDSVLITVLPINDSIVAKESNSVNVPENGSVLVNWVATVNDAADVESFLLTSALGGVDTSTFEILVAPKKGTITTGTSGSFTYSPADGQRNTLDSLIYKICDKGFGRSASLDGKSCATAIYYFNISDEANAPQINEDSIIAIEDSVISFNPLTNDSDSLDIGGAIDPSTFEILFPGTDLNPVWNGDSVTINPTLDFFGKDSLKYKVCDFDGICDSAWVYINVTPVNDAPIAINDIFGVGNSDYLEDNVYEVIFLDVDVNDAFDNDLKDKELGAIDRASVEVLTPFKFGTFVINSDTNTLTYTPSLNFNGRDTLIYRVADFDGVYDTAIVVFNISPVNDQTTPIDTIIQMDEDNTLTLDLRTIVKDQEGVENITFQFAGGQEMIDAIPGSIKLDFITEYIFTYTPALHYNSFEVNGKIETVLYFIRDGNNPLVQGSFKIQINPVNDRPIAVDDIKTIKEDVVAVIDVTNNDSDISVECCIDPITVKMLTTVSNGTLVLDKVTGKFTYSPKANYFGIETFTYEVCDTNKADSLCDRATVTITVQSENDAPIANDITIIGKEDTKLTGTVFGDNVSDLEIDGKEANTGFYSFKIDYTAEEVKSILPGIFVFNGVTGEFSFTPALDTFGVFQIRYTVYDNHPLDPKSDIGLLILNIKPVNDPPVFVVDTIILEEDSITQVEIVPLVKDIEEAIDTPSITVVVPPMHGTVSVDSVTGVIIYTPDLNFTGIDSIIIKVCDKNVHEPLLAGECTIDTLYINLINKNDAPEGDTLYFTTYVDIEKEFEFLVKDVDDEYEDLRLSFAVESGVLGKVRPDFNSAAFKDGYLTFEYEAGTQTGIDTFRLFVVDAAGAETPIVVIMNVLPVTIEPMEGITPNGDGYNDVWIVKEVEYFPENSVQIFNRWGNVVWETENYSNEENYWEGDTNVGGLAIGETLPAGTYFYVFTVDIYGSQKVFKGFVVLGN